MATTVTLSLTSAIAVALTNSGYTISMVFSCLTFYTIPACLGITISGGIIITIRVPFAILSCWGDDPR